LPDQLDFGGDTFAPQSDQASGAAPPRTSAGWHDFYRSQTRGNNCLPTAMSMMRADWATGHPANNDELRQIEHITGVGAHGGYTGSAEAMARQASSMIPGLQTHVYEGLNRQALGAALDQELAKGHTAIVGIKSPYSSGNHYIYVAGKDQNGNYMIGDSGRHGGGILGPSISRDDLLNRMMARHGGERMVAGWTDATTPATQIGATASGRFAAMPHEAPPGVRRDATVPNGDPRILPPEAYRARKSDGPVESGERRQVAFNDMIVDVPNNLDPSNQSIS
jgi:hypothetical protein